MWPVFTDHLNCFKCGWAVSGYKPSSPCFSFFTNVWGLCSNILLVNFLVNLREYPLLTS